MDADWFAARPAATRESRSSEKAIRRCLAAITYIAIDTGRTALGDPHAPHRVASLPLARAAGPVIRILHVDALTRLIDSIAVCLMTLVIGGVLIRETNEHRMDTSIHRARYDGGPDGVDVTVRRSGASAMLIAVMVGSLASCQFQRRSADYSCDSQADCSGGRVCSGGWCIESGDGGSSIIDADPNAPDAPPLPDSSFVCPESCSRCEAETCVMDCALSDSCAAEVVCPPGVKCRVDCGGRNSCGGGIDCSAASDCLITCAATDACALPIVCGTGPCRVNCTASATCAMGIDCAASCQCDTLCSGGNACMSAPTCPSGVCTDIGTNDCKSDLDPSCRTCSQ